MDVGLFYLPFLPVTMILGENLPLLVEVYLKTLDLLWSFDLRTCF
jgi:hypothetical protein